MLRVEAGARALRMLVKNMCGWTERASAGVQGTCVWAWVSGAPVMSGWACDGKISFLLRLAGASPSAKFSDPYLFAGRTKKNITAYYM